MCVCGVLLNKFSVRIMYQYSGLYAYIVIFIIIILAYSGRYYISVSSIVLWFSIQSVFGSVGRLIVVFWALLCFFRVPSVFIHLSDLRLLQK